MSGGPGKQRYIVVDERHVGAEDLPGANLMRAVSELEQSRTPQDVMRVAGRLAEWLWDPCDDELKRAFTDWVWRLAGAIRAGGCGVAGGTDVGGCEDDAGRTAGRLHHPHLLGGRPLGGMVKRV